MELRQEFTGPSQLHDVRVWALECCQALACPAVASTVELIVDELVSNAFLHAMSPASVCLSREGPVLFGAVTDFGGGRVARRPLSAAQSDGWGLNLVEDLSGGWGVDYHPIGKTVSFSLPCPREGLGSR